MRAITFTAKAELKGRAPKKALPALAHDAQVKPAEDVPVKPADEKAPASPEA